MEASSPTSRYDHYQPGGCLTRELDGMALQEYKPASAFPGVIGRTTDESSPAGAGGGGGGPGLSIFRFRLRRLRDSGWSGNAGPTAN